MNRANLSKGRILVVDDSPIAVNILQARLEGEGYEVISAMDGIEAVKKVYQEHPDLIILDIFIPRINGYQVCRLLKHDDATFHIPIIMLTGSESGDRFWSLKTGADEFLTKDFELQDLMETVERLLSNSNAVRRPEKKPSNSIENGELDDEVFIMSKLTNLLDRELYNSTVEKARLETILNLSRALGSTLDLHLLLREIDNSAVRLTGADAGSIMLFDKRKESLYFRSASGEKAVLVKPLRVRSGIAWWVAQHGKVARVNDVVNDERYTGTIDKLSGYKARSVLCVPVTLEDETIGVIEVLNKVDGTGFTDDDEKLLSILASQAAVVVRNARLATEQRNFFTNVIEILVTAIEATLPVPEGYCWRVAKLATAIGRKIGMEDQEIQDLYYGALLHDLGILILRQNGPEMENRMELHPTLGANMVRAVDILNGTEPIIRHHHEYLDGTGYPDSLKGEAIPLGARIIGVVEAYEEAISAGKDRSSARAEIQEKSGRLFDPVVVGAFLELTASDGD